MEEEVDEAKDGDEDDEECAQYLAESVCQRPPPFDGSMCCLLSLSSSAKLRLPEDAACSTMCTLHISVHAQCALCTVSVKLYSQH